MSAQLQENGESRVLEFDPAATRTRRKWLFGAAGIAVVVAIAAAVWMSRGSATKPTTLAASTSIPLVSVVTPGVQPVATEVNFTGTIEALHELPIGNSGDTGQSRRGKRAGGRPCQARSGSRAAR